MSKPNKEKIKIFVKTEQDSLVNLVAGMNTGQDRLTQTYNVNTGFGSYQEMSAMYQSWLGRRIVDLVPEEALKKGFEIVCPSWEPEKLFLLERYIEKLNLPTLLLEALKSERCFGGSVIVALTDASWGSMRNQIPDFLPKRTLLGIQMFDAWQTHATEINFNNPLTSDFLYPTKYTIGSAGLSSMTIGKDGERTMMGAIVDSTRVERFGGEWIPWYERQRNMYWGASVLTLAYDAIRNAGIVDNSIASLLFRASVPVLKVQDLINIVSDPEAKMAFMKRIELLNYQMSNNNMAVVDAEEDLSNLELGALSGLDQILERYYVLVSSATGIPVTKLIGESAHGLNATGEGDLNNYYDMLETYQINKIKPRLLNILKRWVVPSYFDELLPRDFDIVFPALERESEAQKQERNSNFVDLIIRCIDAELITKKVGRKELVERDIFNNFNEEDIEEMEKELGENEVSLTDALDMADELYNKGD